MGLFDIFRRRRADPTREQARFVKRGLAGVQEAAAERQRERLRTQREQARNTQRARGGVLARLRARFRSQEEARRREEEIERQEQEAFEILREAGEPVVLEEATEEDRFLYGAEVWSAFTSSNVKSAQYHWHDQVLTIGFLEGSFYQYFQVSVNEAKSFYDAGSKGRWVWDNLRVRQTVFGYRKEYAWLEAFGPGRLWAKTAATRAAHDAVQEGGETLEDLHKIYPDGIPMWVRRISRAYRAGP